MRRYTIPRNPSAARGGDPSFLVAELTGTTWLRCGERLSRLGLLAIRGALSGAPRRLTGRTGSQRRGGVTTSTEQTENKNGADRGR